MKMKKNISSFLKGASKSVMLWTCFLAFLFVAGCTVQMEVTDNRKQDNQPDGGLVYPEDIPESFSWRRFYWEQIEKSDSTYSFAITDGSNDGRWTDSVRWLPALPGIKVVGDTLATRAYARTQGGGSGDNLGNHIATQNIQLGSNYLSSDGDNEGFSVNASGDITHSAKTTLSDTVYTTGARPVEIKKVNTLTWSANELTAFSLEQNESGKISSWNTGGGLFLKGVTSSGANPGIGLYAYTGAQPTTWGNFMVNTSVHDGAGSLIPVADGSPMVKFRNSFGDRFSLFGNGDLVLQDGGDTSALISVNELAFPKLSYLAGDSVLVADENNRIGKRAVSDVNNRSYTPGKIPYSNASGFLSTGNVNYNTTPSYTNGLVDITNTSVWTAGLSLDFDGDTTAYSGVSIVGRGNGGQELNFFNRGLSAYNTNVIVNVIDGDPGQGFSFSDYAHMGFFVVRRTGNETDGISNDATRFVTNKPAYIFNNGNNLAPQVLGVGVGNSASSGGYNVAIFRRDSTVDNSTEFPPVNFLYTNSSGVIMSAPVKKMPDVKLVETSTAGSGTPNALASDETGKVLTNEGSTAQNYHTLPTAAAGLTFTFVVQDADGIRIVANTGDTIRVAGTVSASAGYTESTTIGDVITLVAINATEWIAISYVGTWTTI